MALILKDRVKVTTTTTGTGTLTLGSAVAGFQDFSVIGDGNTTYYTINDASGGEWEVGIGTYDSTGGTLSRDVVLESSNSGSLVDFAAGDKIVFVTYPAEKSSVSFGGVITANYTAGPNEGVVTDTTGGSFTVTLPASPITGAQVVISDAGGAWGTNNLTVARNGSTIAGVADDFILDINSVSVQFVYDGTTWNVYAQVGGQSGLNSFTRTSVTATPGQTVFNVTYVAGFLQVYLNGVLLATTDYTATDGATVTLASAASGGDIVEFIAYNTQPIGTAATATNLAGGDASQIPYQSAVGTTAFIPNGTAGQTLVSQGASVPTWGTLGVSGGGTGASSLTGVVVGDGTNPLSAVAPGTEGQVLKLEGSPLAPVWGDAGGVASNYQQFTSSGTWTKPSDATWVYIEAIGGGAGGGTAEYVGFNVSSGGGGGGAFNNILLLASDITSTVSVTVGSGGNPSSNGGNSTFGSYLTATGGKTSEAASTPNQAIGGEAGSGAKGGRYITVSGNPILVPSQGGYGGGAGGTGNEDGASCVAGGAGGAGGGQKTGGISSRGGNGGSSPFLNNTQGGSGTAPGGGGSGARATTTTTQGGSGAAGRVRVWAW